MKLNKLEISITLRPRDFVELVVRTDADIYGYSQRFQVPVNDLESRLDTIMGIAVDTAKKHLTEKDKTKQG